MKVRLWPASLAGRTALTLILGFAAIQGIGLAIHTYNELNLERIAQEQKVATDDARIYRQILRAAPPARPALIARLNASKEVHVRLSAQPSLEHAFELPLDARQLIRASFLNVGFSRIIHPRDILLRGKFDPPRIVLSLPPRFDLEWVVIATRFIPPAPWRSPGFATAFIVMFLLGVPLIGWAVRHLTAPVRTLSIAADRLGRDVTHAPSLPEDGPAEIAAAAVAFNTMAARIRRFVDDRTFLLTAIGHDLRTPITRLKLRTEFLEDEEAQGKFFADLDELEAMVAATLAFGRDVAQSEAMSPIDLATLLRTLLDEAADADPDAAADLSYSGPGHLTVRARPMSLKRALANLLGNALKYGDAARVRVRLVKDSFVHIEVEDDGPGIPLAEIERVFEPFRRVETSRNRETGGTGLGLAIARNAIRAHGGDITLANKPDGGGLIATVSLPL